MKYIFGVISGNFGSGKTLFLTNFGKEYSENYSKVYANFPIYKISNFEFLSEISKDKIFSLEKNSLLLLQEGYHYFDRRFCIQKKNKEIGKAIFQIRKRNINVVTDIPRLKYLDFRMIDIATFYLRAAGSLERYSEKLKDIFCYYVVKPTCFSGLGIDFCFQKKFYLDASKLYEYYDTSFETREEEDEEKAMIR